jgi:hypothetical protein
MERGGEMKYVERREGGGRGAQGREGEGNGCTRSVGDEPGSSRSSLFQLSLKYHESFYPRAIYTARKEGERPRENGETTEWTLGG